MILAAFMVGSFAGAAFGVFFTLSLQPSVVSRQSSATSLQPPAANEDSVVIAAVKKVSPSVVNISVLKDVSRAYGQSGAIFPFDEYFGFTFPKVSETPPNGKKQQVGGGTGFMISSDGLILTNRHVVLDDGADYEVVRQDGKTYKASVLARDAVLDLAVLKIDATDLPVAELGDSDALQAGETVIAIGNALSEYQNSVTKGVVSGINRRVVAGGGFGFSEVIEEAIQTDAAINPGNSGGPLINLEGKVVGVNTAVNSNGQSIGFTIPINVAKTVIESVRKHGRIVRPWLGVRYVTVTKELAESNGLTVTEGALVVRGSKPTDLAVVPGSPADKAGIVENDILVEVDGVKITAERSLSGLVGRKTPGDIVAITVMSKGEKKIVRVTLGELPENLK